MGNEGVQRARGLPNGKSSGHRKERRGRKKLIACPACSLGVWGDRSRDEIRKRGFIGYETVSGGGERLNHLLQSPPNRKKRAGVLRKTSSEKVRVPEECCRTKQKAAVGKGSGGKSCPQKFM